MIEEATRPAADQPPEVDDRWRRRWMIAFALVIVVGAGFAVGRRMNDPAPLPAAATPAPASSAPASSAAAPVVAPTPTRPTPTPDPLKLPGAVPTHGSGAFLYASTRGPVLGGKGQLRRFRVAVEKGSNEDPQDFAEQVAATLGDPRGWTGGGTLRLQMVAGSDPADFTVYLATRDTAGKMCERGGTNIRIGGVPYTSCRATRKAIINLDRWRLSAPPFVGARVPLTVYRQYVINHEVGHELGHHHQGCPKAHGPAPVMVQQTLTLRGCVPNAWPRRGNGWLVGGSL